MTRLPCASMESVEEDISIDLSVIFDILPLSIMMQDFWFDPTVRALSICMTRHGAGKFLIVRGHSSSTSRHSKSRQSIRAMNYPETTAIMFRYSYDIFSTW